MSELSCLVGRWVVLMVKNPSASAGDIRDVGLITGSGRFPEGGHGNPPQYSCLENPMDRGAWWATVHGVANKAHEVTEVTCTHAYRTLSRCCSLVCLDVWETLTIPRPWNWFHNLPTQTFIPLCYVYENLIFFSLKNSYEQLG